MEYEMYFAGCCCFLKGWRTSRLFGCFFFFFCSTQLMQATPMKYTFPNKNQWKSCITFGWKQFENEERWAQERDEKWSKKSKRRGEAWQTNKSRRQTGWGKERGGEEDLKWPPPFSLVVNDSWWAGEAAGGGEVRGEEGWQVCLS